MLIPHVPRPAPPPPRFVCRDHEQVSTQDASLPHHTSDHSVMNCSHVVFSNLGIFRIALCPGLSVPCHLSHGGREGVKGSTPTKRQCWFAPTLLRVWDLRPRGGCFGNVSTSLFSSEASSTSPRNQSQFPQCDEMAQWSDPLTPNLGITTATY